jgi:hypothetical protein
MNEKWICFLEKYLSSIVLTDVAYFSLHTIYDSSELVFHIRI